MSSRNGDKARFGRQRKQKIAKRSELRALRAAQPGPGAQEKPAAEEKPAPEALATAPQE